MEIRCHDVPLNDVALRTDPRHDVASVTAFFSVTWKLIAAAAAHLTRVHVARVYNVNVGEVRLIMQYLLINQRSCHFRSDWILA